MKTIDDYIREADAQAASAAEVKPAEYPYTDMSFWEVGGSPDPVWTVPGVVPAGHLTLFSGAGATGKSTLMLQLAVAHVLGRDWLNWMPEMGPVIYCDAEDDNNIIYRRLDLILQHYGASFANLVEGGLHVMSLAGKNPILVNGKLELTPLYRKLAEDIERINPIQIIVANSANVFAGNEIDRVQVGRFVHTMTAMVTGSERSLILISHPSLTGISTGTGLSGSTQWYNSARAQIYLTRKNGEDEEEDKFNAPRELSFKKNQYGPESPPVVLKWQRGLYLPVAGPSDLERAQRGQNIREKILEELKYGTRLSPSPGRHYAASRLKTFGYGKAEAEAALREMIDQGTIELAEDGPPSQRSKFYRVRDTTSYPPPS